MRLAYSVGLNTNDFEKRYSENGVLSISGFGRGGGMLNRLNARKRIKILLLISFKWIGKCDSAKSKNFKNSQLPVLDEDFTMQVLKNIGSAQPSSIEWPSFTDL